MIHDFKQDQINTIIDEVRNDGKRLCSICKKYYDTEDVTIINFLVDSEVETCICDSCSKHN